MNSLLLFFIFLYHILLYLKQPFFSPLTDISPPPLLRLSSTFCLSFSILLSVFLSFVLIRQNDRCLENQHKKTEMRFLRVGCLTHTNTCFSFFCTRSFFFSNTNNFFFVQGLDFMVTTQKQTNKTFWIQTKLPPLQPHRHTVIFLFFVLGWQWSPWRHDWEKKKGI